jgi:hypothetical protein
MATASGNTSYSASNQTSGGVLDTIWMALVDQFGQVVGSDSTSTATLSIVGNHSSDTYTPILTGTSTVTASNGAFEFIDITFTAEPGTTYSKVLYFINLALEVTTTGIDSKLPSNAVHLTTNSVSNTSLSVTIELRLCVEGESFETDGSCVECAAETLYSLATSTTVSTCLDCQTKKMFCYGGNDIGPRPGYWRSSTSSDNFIA